MKRQEVVLYAQGTEPGAQWGAVPPVEVWRGMGIVFDTQGIVYKAQAGRGIIRDSDQVVCTHGIVIYANAPADMPATAVSGGRSFKILSGTRHPSGKKAIYEAVRI